MKIIYYSNFIQQIDISHYLFENKLRLKTWKSFLKMKSDESLLFRNKQNKAEKKNRKNTTMSNISRAKMSGKYKYELIRAKSLRLTLIRAEVCRIQDLWHAGKIKKRRSHEMFLYCGWEFFLSVPQIWDLAEAKDWITVTWYAHTSLKYKLVNFWYQWLTFSGLVHYWEKLSNWLHSLCVISNID